VSKPIVLIAEELSPATVEALGPDFEIRYCDGADREQLLPALPDVDAVMVRSATQMDAEALAAAENLKVIARAGVGLDNVDVPASTAAGVMVVNAPTSNIVSAAEIAVGLLIACARNIAPANAALKAGEWKRSKYSGVELQDKVAGIVGLGRIGMLVAQRLSAFGMQLIAYDPYVPPARAGQLGVRMVDLDELLATSDFISVHLPKTPETVGLIGDEALHKVKPSVRIINAARGGIVDEAALAQALADGRVAGAGVEGDEFAASPDPRHVGHTADVDESHGASIEAGRQGAVVDRHQGSALPPSRHVCSAHVIDNLAAGLPRQCRAAAELNREADLGSMNDGLTVTADNVDVRTA